MARIAHTKNVIILIAGDLVAYLFSLVAALTIRYGQIPGRELMLQHIPAFSILSVIFILVNFSAGLYDKQPALMRGRIQGLLVKVQIVNALIGITFFYFAPVAITPKANLFIYFVISTIALLIWRTVMYPVVSITKKQVAVLVGGNVDIQNLYEEINGDARYAISFKAYVKPLATVEQTTAAIAEAVKKTGASAIMADLHDPAIEATMPYLYSLIFSGLQIVDAGKMYETVFDRIPLSMVGERWVLENSGTAIGSRRVYDLLKRLMDIVIALILSVVLLVVFPFVYVAVKLEDRGPVFIEQERVGTNGKTIKIYKFRSMSGNDSGKYGSQGKTVHVVTRVGRVIRMTRIDELPQLWSVVKGDQSLIGPRPELPSLAGHYDKEIPYYNVRHLIKPGLSGWAQIYHRNHPHHGVAVGDARDKLLYDLYYVKHRSFMLDVRIALQTAKAMISRQGV